MSFGCEEARSVDPLNPDVAELVNSGGACL